MGEAFPGSYNGEWLDRQHFPPLQWIIPGIIPEGQTLLVGPPKAGKSWLVYAIALARATGGQALGQQSEPGPVLYLALEDGQRRLQYRGRRLLGTDPLPSSITYANRAGPEWMTDTTVWLDKHANSRPLVIVDTLGKVKPAARAGASAYEHDYAVMSVLKAMVDDVPGSAQVLVHHDRKASSDDFLDNVSGTHGLAGAADTTVVLGRPRTEAAGVLSVTGREVTEAEYAVTFDNGIWQLNGTDLDAARDAVVQQRASANLGDRSADILQYVYEHPEGVRPREVADRFGMAPPAAAAYLGRLLDAGRIDRPVRGTYTPVVSVVSVVSGEESPADTTHTTHTTGGIGGSIDAPIDASNQNPPSGRPCGHPGPPTARCGTCIAAKAAARLAGDR